MWQFLHRLTSFHGNPSTSQKPHETAHPQLETLESRQLLSSTPVTESLIGSTNRTTMNGYGWKTEMVVSRFDQQTGAEEVLYSKEREVGIYGGESIGQVGKLSDGDVIFQVDKNNWMSGPQSSAFYRLNPQTKVVTPVYVSSQGVSDFAVAPGDKLIVARTMSGFAGFDLTISRVDPTTRTETLLSHKSQGIYESIGQVAALPDGDVIYSIDHAGSNFTQVSDVYRYDEQTKSTAKLFTTDAALHDMVYRDGKIITTRSRWMTNPNEYKTTFIVAEFGMDGTEKQLFSETTNNPLGLYESANPVTLASDGDVIFSQTKYQGIDTTAAQPVRRIDAQTGAVAELFSTPTLVGLAAASSRPIINIPNLPPIVVNDRYYMDVNTTLRVNGRGVMTNDRDPEGDHMNAYVVEGPVRGTLTLNADGSFQYTPKANFYGADAFGYKVSDGRNESILARVLIRIDPPGNAPVGRADFYSVNEDAVLNRSARHGVLRNDSDADGDTLRAVLTKGPNNGTLTLNADGSFRYTPKVNFFGTDAFTYTTNDGTRSSGPVTVTIEVRPENDRPVAGNDSYSVQQNTRLIVTGRGVLSNDSDVDRDALSSLLTNGPRHGRLKWHTDGTFEYTPDRGWTGTDWFTYRAYDGRLRSHLATVNLIVKA